MWHKIKKQVKVEKEQLNLLLEKHRSLLIKCITKKPNEIELSALSSMLHSFYTGIENIFKRIAVAFDDGLPKSQFWHRQLLDSMTRPNFLRKAVLSAPLRDVLRGYLDFRHVFRHAYTFELRWEKMAKLVLEVETVLRQLEGELDTFLI